MKKALIVCAAMVLLATLCFGLEPKEAAGEEVLKTLSFLKKGHRTARGFEMYVKRLNEKAKGELTLKIIGGPEAIPTGAQAEAARSGVVDVYFTPSGRLRALVPEASTLLLSELSPSEERKVGYHDFLNQLHNKVGLVYLGRTWENPGFHLWTNVKVKKLEDLSGLKFRGTPFYHAVLKPLGMVPVAMPLGDIYEAMDRGLIDGWACSPNTALSRKLYEVTKYCIDHPFWSRGNAYIVVNLDAWNRLPKRLQKLMVDVLVEMEPEIAALYKKEYEDNVKQLAGQGMEFIKFSSADAKRFNELAVRMKWEDMLKASPENVAKMRKMITK